MKLFLQTILLITIFCLKSYALSPEEHLADETKEQRARSLFLEVRCLVCEGQVIESSDTEFSFEMRKLIRKKISEGKSDDEIRNDLVKEFGDDILISEIHGKNKFFLFTLPALFAALSFFGIKKFYRQN
ncbi:MAG: cytochrome c-type biogenesis protein CcmH [Rickettsiales bacterium]|nr:cytochrome c-type biogenesis protein CcmH [Rickettsiales bacterium]